MTMTRKRKAEPVAPLPRSLRGAALQRLSVLRAQRDSFAEQAAKAEADVTAYRATLKPWETTAGQVVRLTTLEDTAHRQRQSDRTASRIVAEAERNYVALFDEPAPAHIKVCADCGEPKPLDEFPTHSASDRPRSFCRPCFLARQRAGYHRHRDKRLADMKLYRQRRDPEQRRAYMRAYYAANREKWRGSRRIVVSAVQDGSLDR